MTFLPCNIWGGPLWKIWKITNGWGSGAAQRFDVLVPGWSELASVLAKKLKNCLSMQSQRDYRESATIYVVYSGGQKSGRTDRRSSERFGTIFFICGHVHWKERGELTSQRTDMTARVAGGIWLCVTFGGRKTHYLVDGFDVLSRSVLPWSINN